MDFIAWLQQPKNGDLLHDLNEQIAEAVRATVEQEKPSKVMFGLKIEMASKRDMDTLVVTPEITAKLPIPSRKGGIWFVSENFGLSRSPNQLTMQPQEEEVPPVGTADGEIPEATE